MNKSSQGEGEKPEENKKSIEKVFNGPGDSRVVVTENTISFTGYSTKEDMFHDVKLNLAHEVDPDSATCSIAKGSRTFNVDVQKKELSATPWKVLVVGEKIKTNWDRVSDVFSREFRGLGAIFILAFPVSNMNYSFKMMTMILKKNNLTQTLVSTIY